MSELSEETPGPPLCKADAISDELLWTKGGQRRCGEFLATVTFWKCVILSISLLHLAVALWV